MNKKRQASGIKKTRPGWIFIAAVMLLLVNLVGCDSLDIPWLPTREPSVPGTPTNGNDDLTPTQAVSPTPTPLLPPESLTIWVPPDMGIEGDQPAATLLKAKLDAFASENGNIQINVRLKEVSGAGGLLDALIATNAAAPSSLPDLIALPRADLETAALKSLVYPIDDLTSVVDEPNWYPYAQAMSLIQGVVYGVPFLGDALVLAYRTDVLDVQPSSWESVAASDLILGFAANDSQAALTLALYQASGGAVEDNQRRPTLDVEVLTEVFKFYSSYISQSAISEASLGFQNENQAYQAFQKGEVTAVVLSLARYMQSPPENTSIVMLPPLLDAPASGASGWVWAVATPNPLCQELAVRLAENLVEPFFLSGWSQALGWMPVRPSALESWEISNYKPLLHQVSTAGILKPNNDIINTLGPILRDAAMQVLQGLVDPTQAAEVAKESLQ